MIEENLVEEVAGVGEDSSWCGCGREIVGVDRIGRDDYLEVAQVASVGAEAEVHGETVGAEIGAIANDDRGL